MKIDKVLETVFIKEFNTTAHILRNGVVVKLWDNKYMDRAECFKYIAEHCKGWVQASEAFREAKILGRKTGVSHDPIAKYIELYNDVEKYANDMTPW